MFFRVLSRLKLGNYANQETISKSSEEDQLDHTHAHLGLSTTLRLVPLQNSKHEPRPCKKSDQSL